MRLTAMTYCSHVTENSRKHHENESLDKADKYLKTDKGSRSKIWKEEGHNQEQNLSGDNITKKTESKRDDFGELRKQLEDTHKEVDGTLKIKKLLEVAKAKKTESVDLDHDHGDDGERECSV